MRISLVQLKVEDNKGENISNAQKAISNLESPELVVLPEMFNCPYSVDKFPEYAETYPEGETIRFLSETAKEKGIFLVGGSIPERDRNRIYNTSFAFNPKGEMIARHRKIHLFDVHLDDGLSVKESNTLTPGSQKTIFPVGNWRVGVIICYDLRFPELVRDLVLAGADLVVIPAAFSVTTGTAHWDFLLRARAVDNQIFVAGVSPARNANAHYQAYGHSLLADPWGVVLARAGTEQEVLETDITKDRIDEIRKQLPLLQHRRPDIYQSS